MIAILSRRFSKTNLSNNGQVTKKKKKKLTKTPIKVPTTEDEEEPLSLSSSSSSKTNTIDDSENNAIALAAAAVQAQELPYAKYVNLTPEERKFHCQIRVMAHEVKYAMVTTVVNSWEQDLKIIPDWEKIGGELLLRKYVQIKHLFVTATHFPR
jgi:hypothetical protein